MRNANLFAVACLLLASTASLVNGVEVVTQHNDNSRTGVNTQEPALTPATVNTAGFGKLFTTSMNANVNGQALYVPGLAIAGGTHNTVFVYTSNNSDGSPCGIYSFDADTGAGLWSRTLTNAAQYTTNTPVIDSAAKTMYFVSKDNDNNGANWIHAVDITTGAEKAGSPAQIAGSVAGTGDGAVSGTVTFPATHANCRPGLLLMNGVLYLGFAFNSDARPYHGWVLSYTYNGTAFTRTHIFCVSPNKEAGGIWQAGKGLVGDGTFVYCTTGNGSFDNNIAAGSAFGMCFLRLNTSLQVQDYFAEANESGDSNGDADLGNCGAVMIPGTSVLFAGAAKYGRGHLVDAANMGHWTSGTDACLQTVSSGLSGSVGQNPVAFDAGGGSKYVYCWSNGHGIAQFRYDGATRHFVDGTGAATANPLHTGAATNGGSLCVSANGTGGGILWAAGGDGVVHAYDATNVTTELWNSNQNAGRDGLGGVGHFQFPMVVAGKVYVPTGNSKLVAYGLLSVQTATKLAITQQPGSVSAGAAITPAVKVTIQDASGATVTSATNAVTIAIGNNPAGGTLSGTLTVNAVNGVATFSNLTINNTGTGYTLTATAAGLTGTTTNAFNILAQVATPVINPNGGTYSGPVTVRLTTATAGATIHYTTDGSTPTAASATYSAPFMISATSTLKVIAQKAGMTDSVVASAAFTISGATAYGMPYRPTISGVTLPANLGTAPPATLSGTGIFSTLATLTPAAGIVPYNVNTPLWSDAALKQRWAALPGTSQIVFSATGEWSFPGGTFFIKHFELGTDDTNPATRKRLETRILYVNAAAPNNGYGITYKWRADNSDADLLTSAGLDEAITITTASGTRSQTWHYPSQGECLTCHTSYSGFVLGPKTRQLNGTFNYPSTGTTDNQLRTWNYLQMFTTNIGEGNIAGFSRSKAIGDTSATLEDRVKSYLDANCAQCHRPGGVATAWDARYDTLMANQGIIYGAVKTDLGVTGAKVVTPQNVGLSLMDYRMNSTNAANKMPPLARNLVDSAAVAVLDQWINSLVPAAPGISSFTPTSGPVGTVVTITGSNFTGATTVKFHGTTATTFTVVSATSIIATVPAGTTTGTIAVTTPAGTGTSAGSFTITTGTPAPFISSIAPTSGGVGTSVTVNGANFAGATSVKFNGTTAVFVVNSGARITATVPTGATTGTITVTTPGGTATSATFTVVPAPTITGITPTTGTAGATVTITGTNLTGATVSFNGTAAAITSNNGTQIVTHVPAGATNGMITVTTAGGTATSASSFTTGIAPSSSKGCGGGGIAVMIGLLVLAAAARRWRLVD